MLRVNNFGRSLRTILAMSVAGAGGSAAWADVFPVSPRATYLRTNSDTPDMPTIVDLSTVRSADGDGGRYITITALGDFAPGAALPDTHMAMIAVFASSSQVLSPATLNRVVGAIDVAEEFVSGPTYYGSLPTDIPQDFAISFDPVERTVVVGVPLGATHLMVGMMDSFFGDNRDPDADLAVAVNSVPEPAAIGLLAMGAAALLRRRR